MRLAGALIDQARVLRQVAGAVRVEGRSPVTQVAGEWTAARLIPGGSTEAEGPGGRRATAQQAQLLLAHGDVRASDEVEVRSMVGDSVWRIAAEPEVLRARRWIIGTLVRVERLGEPVRESVSP